jgi:hypothetical protein
MEVKLKHEITFARLPEIEPSEILAHMSDPRVSEHMPLLTFEWDAAAVTKFIATKEECWVRDGLGHWAILSNNKYVGWGGFQKEGDEWDFGLVLSDERIPFVTFLLPPSRKNLGALERLGARRVDEIEYDGATFLKYRLETE